MAADQRVEPPGRAGFPDTPAGQHLAWVIHALRRAAEGELPAADEEAAHFGADGSTGNPAPIPRVEFWTTEGARFTPSFRVIAVETRSAHEAAATLVRDDGKAWAVACTVEA